MRLLSIVLIRKKPLSKKAWSTVYILHHQLYENTQIIKYTKGYSRNNVFGNSFFKEQGRDIHIEGVQKVYTHFKEKTVLKLCWW